MLNTGADDALSARKIYEFPIPCKKKTRHTTGTHFELNVMLISGCVGSSLDEFWGYRVDWYLFFVAESCFAGRGP